MTTGVAAIVRRFLRIFLGLAAVCLFGVASAPCVSAQIASEGSSGTITHIQFEGNRRVQRATLIARMFSREGDPYNEENIRRDFLALWNTQYFEDIRLEVEDDPKAPGGKLVIFYVTERPIIRRIEYKGNKSVSESDILDRFKDRKVGLTVESRFDPTVIKHAQVVLQQLLAEHGHQFAVVKPTYEKIAATNAVKLIFNIEEGPKVKVGQIKFEGNKTFSTRKLIRTMRHSRPIAIPLEITDINIWDKTFDRDKLDEDLEVGVRGYYQDHGFFRVIVHDPILNTVDENRAGFRFPCRGLAASAENARTSPSKLKRANATTWATSTSSALIPIKASSSSQISSKRFFLSRRETFFRLDKLRKAFDNYKKLYGEYGYIDFTSKPSFDILEDKKIVNLTPQLQPGQTILRPPH